MLHARDIRNGIKYITTDEVTVAVIADVKSKGNPRPRLTLDGYTVKGGSPTPIMIRFMFEPYWHRVFVLQFSNAASTFIKRKNEKIFVNLAYMSDGSIQG